jgi:hypothetical protein
MKRSTCAPAGRYLFAFLLLVSAMASHGEKPPHRLDVALTSNGVSVKKATAGGSVLLVGYELTARDYSPVYRRVQRDQTAGADGSVQFDLGRPTASKSFWVVFDLTSGSYGASGTAARPLREKELRKEAFKKESNGKRKKVETQFDCVYALAVRPGVGVWDVTVGDGGPEDDDGVLDGKVGISSGRLREGGEGGR